jgi:hypothetical protein
MKTPWIEITPSTFYVITVFKDKNWHRIKVAETIEEAIDIRDQLLTHKQMPTAKVKGKIKHYPYTKAGYKAAAKARKKK